MKKYQKHTMSIEEALYLALDAHRGQVDLDGKPYILHPLRVGLRGQNDEEIIVGLLHDVIEDTKYTLQDIADKGAERDIVEALSLLTHKKNQPYSEYLDRIIDSDNPIAIAVKKNDLLDNLARNDKATEAKQRIYEKHSRAIERLRAEG